MSDFGQHNNTSDKNYPDKKKKKRPPKKITRSYLHNAGVYYLRRFSSSVDNFKRVMMRKVYRSVNHHGEPSIQEAEQMVAEVAQEMIDHDWINDYRYAENKARYYRRKGGSKRKIFKKLMAKGVDQDVIGDAIRSVDDEMRGDYAPPVEQTKDGAAELKAAKRYLERRRKGPYRTKQPIDGEQADDWYQKDLASLSRQGFRYSIAKQAMDATPSD